MPLAGLGDVDGDGFDDVLARVVISNPEIGEDAAYVYRGSPEGLERRPAWRWEGNSMNAWTLSAHGGGDANGDGVPDVLLAADTLLGGLHLFHPLP